MDKTRPAATPWEKSNDVSVKSIQRVITNLRSLDDSLKIYNYKCSLSMVGYDKPDNIDNDDETSANAYDNWLGFAILKCRLLNC